MTKTKAYAAAAPKSPLAPFTIERREPRENDVAIDIKYCGICHSDIIRLKMNGVMQRFLWCQGMKLPA